MKRLYHADQLAEAVETARRMKPDALTPQTGAGEVITPPLVERTPRILPPDVAAPPPEMRQVELLQEIVKLLREPKVTGMDRRDLAAMNARYVGDRRVIAQGAPTRGGFGVQDLIGITPQFKSWLSYNGDPETLQTVATKRLIPAPGNGRQIVLHRVVMGGISLLNTSYLHAIGAGNESDTGLDSGFALNGADGSSVLGMAQTYNGNTQILLVEPDSPYLVKPGRGLWWHKWGYVNIDESWPMVMLWYHIIKTDQKDGRP